jgi:hypothetical protein
MFILHFLVVRVLGLINCFRLRAYGKVLVNTRVEHTSGVVVKIMARLQVALLEGRDGWRALAIGAQTSAIGCKIRTVCACTLKQIDYS